MVPFTKQTKTQGKSTTYPGNINGNAGKHKGLLRVQLVFAHRNSDLDCIAAQLAVTRLYPGTKLVPALPLGPSAEKLFSLYKDSLPLADLKRIDPANISCIFLVDCNDVERLDERAQAFIAKLSSSCKRVIFDHHVQENEPVPDTQNIFNELHKVGSATTILTNKLLGNEVMLSPVECTILLAGIYEDTGCLLYNSTTYDDITCAAELVKRGAMLDMVAELVKRKLTGEQAELLEALLAKTEILEIQGQHIGLSCHETAEFIPGLGEITSHLLQVAGTDIAVCMVKMGKRCHLVARSRIHYLDLRPLAKKYGGGGHKGAIACSVKAEEFSSLQEAARQFLYSEIHPEPQAREIMSRQPRIISPNTTMEEANTLLLRHNETGFVVMADDTICGILSRSDIAKAQHHKLGHAKVSGFMSRPVITAIPETPLSTLQDLMISHQIGLIPIIDKNANLTGLVYRKDVFHATYSPVKRPTDFHGAIPLVVASADLGINLNKLPKRTRHIFNMVADAADELNVRAFAVGGFVRDLFLQRDNFDIDITIEGSAIALANKLAEKYPEQFIVKATHVPFGTAHVSYSGEGTLDIDFATARNEFYTHPASLPTVEPAGLKEDQLRRDFTINALALSLNKNDYGSVIDFWGGLQDLQTKTIRVLHPYSFIEDPARILRACRFSARLGFSLEEKTADLAMKASGLGIFDNLGGARIKQELRLILESHQRLAALRLLKDLTGGLRFLDTGIKLDRFIWGGLRKAQIIARARPDSDNWLLYLGVLLTGLETISLEPCLSRLYLTEDEKNILRSGHQLALQPPATSPSLRHSEIFHLFDNYPPLALAIGAAVSRGPHFLRQAVTLYWDKLHQTKSLLTGEDLKALGMQQGPGIGYVLGLLRDQRLDGKINSKEDEKRWVLKYLQQN